jgi:hypothetical protein
MIAETEISFADISIVACGTLSLELNHLSKSGFLNACKILYTKPGRHEVPRELESQLVEGIVRAKRYTDSVIVVYGGKFCFIDMNDPARSIDRVIAEQAQGVSRIQATHCVDMLASAQERQAISEGEKIFWLTPGWVVFRDKVFQDWDKGKANETFPQHTGGAVLLDGMGFWDEFSAKHPEKILAFSDWMGIPIRPHKVSLSRLKRLLADCAAQVQRRGT